MIARLGIDGAATRKSLYKSLTKFWYVMHDEPFDRYDYNILTRNIFFLVTNTGRCCETCLSFDHDPEDSAHKKICKKKKANPASEVARLGCTLHDVN